MKRKIKDTIKELKDVEPVGFYKLTAGALAGAMLLSQGFVVKLLGVALFIYILYIESKE